MKAIQDLDFFHDKDLAMTADVTDFTRSQNRVI